MQHVKKILENNDKIIALLERQNSSLSKDKKIEMQGHSQDEYSIIMIESLQRREFKINNKT